MLIKAAQRGPEAPVSPGPGQALWGLLSFQQFCGCHLHVLCCHLAGICQGLAGRHDKVSISRQGVQAASNQSLQGGQKAGWVLLGRCLRGLPLLASPGPPLNAAHCSGPATTSPLESAGLSLESGTGNYCPWSYCCGMLARAETPDCASSSPQTGEARRWHPVPSANSRDPNGDAGAPGIR